MVRCIVNELDQFAEPVYSMFCCKNLMNKVDNSRWANVSGRLFHGVQDCMISVADPKLGPNRNSGKVCNWETRSNRDRSRAEHWWRYRPCLRPQEHSGLTVFIFMTIQVHVVQCSHFISVLVVHAAVLVVSRLYRKYIFHRIRQCLKKIYFQYSRNVDVLFRRYLQVWEGGGGCWWII
jgi:hypothetical protein